MKNILKFSGVIMKKIFLLASPLLSCESDQNSQIMAYQKLEVTEYHFGIGKAQKGDKHCGGFLVDHPRIMVTTMRCFLSSRGEFWFHGDDSLEPARVQKVEKLGYGIAVTLLDRSPSWRVYVSQEYDGWDYVDSEIHKFGFIVGCQASKGGYHRCNDADIPDGHPVTLKDSPVLIGVNFVDDKLSYTGNISEGRFVPVMNFYSRFLAIKDKLVRRANGEK